MNPIAQIVRLPGIGDPLELTRRMAARGFIKYPSPQMVAQQLAIADANRVKTTAGYRKAHASAGALSPAALALKLRRQNIP